MTFTLQDAEEMYTKAMDDADKGDYAAFLFVKYCDPFDFVNDDGKGKIDYAKAHREEVAEKKERKREKKKTRARNRQKAAKVKKEAREKKRSDLQPEAMQHLKKKAKRAEKVA